MWTVACLTLTTACASEPEDRCEVLASLCEPAIVGSFTMRPVAMASADLDGDGTIDMVSASPDSGVTIGWGDRSLAARLSGDRQPVDVDVVDLDGDGVLEIVALHRTPAEIEAFRLSGPRTFTSMGTWALEGLPHRFAFADLDADERIDVVVARSLPGGLVVLTKGFNTSATADFGIDIVDVALGDLDDDGAMDALAIDLARSNLHLLSNYGASGFAATQTITTAPGPELVKLVDFDADGLLDVATSGRAQASIAVHHGDGAGELSAAASVATGTADSLGFALVPGEGTQPRLVTAEPDRLTAAEVLDDGSLVRPIRLSATPMIRQVQQHADAVVYAGFSFIARLATTPGTAFRERWRDRTVPLLWNQTRLVSGDLNDDTTADLVLAQTNHLQVYLGRADGGFVPGLALETPEPIGTVFAADITGDGEMDLVIGELGPTPALQVAIGDGDGAFALSAPLVTDASRFPLAVIDTDGDGVYAVVLGAGVGGTTAGCEVLHFADDGAINVTDVPAITGVVEAAQPVDLNGDGGEDLLALTRSATDIQLVTTHAQGLLGWSMPTSRSRTAVAGADATTTGRLGLAAGDLDGDGRVDALLSHRAGVDVFLDLEVGEAEPLFSALAIDEDPAIVSLVDIDGDGASDLLYAGLTVLVGARGTGDGRFEQVLRQQQTTSAATRLPTAEGPPSLAFADQFGLVVGEPAPGPVPEHSYTYSSLDRLVLLSTGDIDDDGRPDIAVGGEAGKNAWAGIGVLWNSAEGRFDRGLSVATFVTALTTANMDGQGGDEIVIVESTTQVLVYYYEEGQLLPRTSAWLPSPDPRHTMPGIAAGDRDGDGSPDLLVLRAGGVDPAELALIELRGADERRFAGDATVLWTGTKGLTLESEAVVPPSLVTADFDADGRIDAVILPHLGKSVVVAWGAGEVTDLQFEDDILAVGAGDMNEDGASELLLGHAAYVAFVPFAGRKPARLDRLAIAGSTGRLIAAEVDGVAPIDLVYQDATAIQVALRDSEGGSKSVFIEGRHSGSAAVDVDLDGRADFLSWGGPYILIQSSRIAERP